MGRADGIQHIKAFDDTTEHRVLHVEVGGSTQFLISRNLVGRVRKRCSSGLCNVADHALQHLAADIPPLDNVKLAAAAAAGRIDLIALTGCGQCAFDMDELGVNFGGNRVAWASIPQAHPGFCSLGFRIASLGHEPFDHPMPEQPVVKTLLGKLEKVVAVFWRLVIEFNHHCSEGSFDANLLAVSCTFCRRHQEGQEQEGQHQDHCAGERDNHRLEFALFVNLAWTMNCLTISDFENMKSNTPLHVFGMLALLFVGAFGFNGCNEIEDTVAVIYVQNSLGAPVQGAEVRLFAVGSVNQTVIGELRFDTTQVTNAAGSVSFNFSEYYQQGQAGFAVLDIEATKGSLEGIGIIKIEEELTNEQTVIME